MSGVIFVIIIVAAIVAITELRRSARLQGVLDEEERAFEEQIHVTPYDLDQLLRLRPLVAQIGILRMPSALEPEQYADRRDSYQVFALDSLGAVHDVCTRYVEQEATEIANYLSTQLRAQMVE